ncbi:hypothetical protein [Massilia horti]|uniref:Uncharacterized protein n=1 Tax=Massilia horti TaxID=2562153 RepID=A0A4Y9SUT7_9BURK|nr:hypothetical protein [Massilia horti]TFW30198.1 hypothetical protein E4O92_17275 [Massilia horti]
MSLNRLISPELVDAVIRLIVETLPWAKDAVTYEVQDDFQFLLVAVQCDTGPELTEDERRQLGRRIDRLMPTRNGELTWMLNFMSNGKVADSYFGGDSRSPELGF